MIHRKKFMKIIAVSVIIVFIFPGDLFLYSTGEDGLDALFNKARNEYNNGQYVTSKKRLEGIVGEIKENVLGRKDILGKCYLLLGAIYEKEEKTNLARENYRKAIRDYKIQAIDGVDFIGLIILEKVIKAAAEVPIEEEGEIDKQFNKARDEYVDGKYRNLKERLESIIGVIKETGSERVGILGMCYLLLGAIYEKENKKLLAEENYRKAKEKYDIQSVDGVDLENLAIYKEVIKGVRGKIEKEGEKKKIRKKFPWLLVAGGVVVVVAAAILILKRKKKKYTLTVDRGEGVVGDPASGTYKYKKGQTVWYDYRLRDGYSNLIILLNGEPLTSSSGPIEMNRNHILEANATANTVEFVTDKEKVNIDEGGTETLDVKLSSQPTGNVQVTVSRLSGDEDIRVVSGGNLTFTTSDWNEYQTVKLEAAEDDDAENDLATIRISASGIPNKDINATGVDNDSLNFVTNTNEVTVVEGGTKTFQVKLSGEPSSDVAVSISRVSGDSDISVTAKSSYTFTPSNWNDYQTVTLRAAEDPDAENGTAKIRISAPGIPNKDITATEVDNDSLNFVTDKVKVSVDEGSTNTFQVKLSSQPSSDVVASIIRESGDSDISVSSGANLTFTPSNWDTYQTVTLAAAEDDDTVNGEATIRISAPGIPYKDITAKEDDNDSLNFVTDKDELSIDEGSTNTFQVRLSSRPSSDITANISRISGDGDISVTNGSNLTFTPSNWNTYQPVTLAAANDDDTINGEATIQISAPGTGIPNKNIVATEVDNDSLNFITDKNEVSVPEGRTATFQVKLTAEPSSNLVASVSFIKQKKPVDHRAGISLNSSSGIAAEVRRVSGDSDITVTGGSSLNFTPSNWNTYQTVTLRAAQDNDIVNGKAIIRISANGITDKDITATEVDNDSLNFVTDKDKLSIEEGGTDKFNVKLSSKPSSNVTASISHLSGDNDISVSSGSSLTFTPSNWNKYQEVRLEAAEDDDMLNGEATIRISSPGIPNKDITATEVDDDIPNFETDKDEVSIDEGTTDTFQVRLTQQPSSDVEAIISVSGDSDISVSSGLSLTFTTSNWDEYQTVTLAVAKDDDMVNDMATIQISAPGTEIPDKEITVTGVDNDIPNFETDKDEVSIDEGNTNTFQVRLTQQPSSDVEARISVSGDSDISVSGSTSLIFTTTNWDTYQEVALAAADDDDTVNDMATIRISAPGTGIPDKEITVTGVDNDTLSFVTDTDEVSIDEGSTNNFQVKLSAKPSSDTAVSISRESGDTHITVSSGSTNITFTPDNWNTSQIVTLAAAEDADAENGTATIRISAPGSGIPDKEITATEVDNDKLEFETDKDEVSIDEGDANTFQVKLTAKPSSDVVVSIVRDSGDSDISVATGSESLTFTPSNWNTYQTVTLEAAEDADAENGKAIILISADGIADKTITATENDNDSS